MLDTISCENPIEFQNVSFSINKQEIIHDINCQLNKAGKTVVMGANGAGKSVFLRLIAGLLKPVTGKVVICENSNPDTCDVTLSLVFQKPVLLRRSTFANVAYVLKHQNHPKQHIPEKVNNALRLARLEPQAQTPARHLSGGEQQRLALARALVVEPGILLLDEATASLDPVSTFIVENMVEEVAANGTKVVFVTHDVRQARRIADDILFIHQGRTLAHKPTKDFFHDPGSQEAQAYLDGRLPQQIIQEI